MKLSQGNKLFIALIVSLASVQGFGASKNTSTSSTAQSSTENDLNSLADDSALIERAKAMDPKNRVQIVQRRAVDRNLRLELGGNYGYISGGDSYLSSQNLGAYLDFHINPNWSVGFRYNNYINSLTNEAKTVYQAAQADVANRTNDARPPAVDSPLNTELGTIAWYPVYGKMNFFNSWVPHFDLYVLGGYGKTQTESGLNSDTFAGGMGIALWLSQHFTSHLEVRYQTFQDRPQETTRSESLVIGQVSLGILL